MKKTPLLFSLLLAFLVSGCSVISPRSRTEALPPMPYPTLLEGADMYIGRTVILGGYILDTTNRDGETRVRILQSPLSLNGEPKDRDRSEGRFVLLYKGFLDPEVYSKDRRLTVAGTILGTETEQIGELSYKLLQVESKEIHLWQDYEYRDYPYYYDDPFWYSPYPYWPRPYWRHPLYWRYYPYW